MAVSCIGLGRRIEVAAVPELAPGRPCPADRPAMKDVAAGGPGVALLDHIPMSQHLDHPGRADRIVGAVRCAGVERLAIEAGRDTQVEVGARGREGADELQQDRLARDLGPVVGVDRRRLAVGVEVAFEPELLSADAGHRLKRNLTRRANDGEGDAQVAAIVGKAHELEQGAVVRATLGRAVGPNAPPIKGVGLEVDLATGANIAPDIQASARCHCNRDSPREGRPRQAGLLRKRGRQPGDLGHGQIGDPQDVEGARRDMASVVAVRRVCLAAEQGRQQYLEPRRRDSDVAPNSGVHLGLIGDLDHTRSIDRRRRIDEVRITELDHGRSQAGQHHIHSEQHDRGRGLLDDRRRLAVDSEQRAVRKDQAEAAHAVGLDRFITDRQVQGVIRDDVAGEGRQPLELAWQRRHGREVCARHIGRRQGHLADRQRIGPGVLGIDQGSAPDIGDGDRQSRHQAASSCRR